MHFKGRHKPWEVVRPRSKCALAHNGRIVARRQADGGGVSSVRLDSSLTVALDADDDLVWDVGRRACLSVRHALPVFWPTEAANSLRNGTGFLVRSAAELPVRQRCCSGLVLVTTFWYATVRRNGEFEQGRRPRDW